MSNKYNPKRSWSEKENSNSKKNKMPEKEFNISIQTIELIESSDDELNNSGEIGELQQTKESSHYRKNINKDWFNRYTWLESEEINQETLIFCKLCRNRNGMSNFSKGTKSFRLDKIKAHSNSNEHKKSESILLVSDTEQSNGEKLSIISLMRNIYFCSKHNISLKKIYPGLCNLMSLQTENNISNKISTLKPASLEKPSKSKSKYGSYKNSIAGFDFLDSIASVIKNSLFDELNSSPYWSVMIDEANSVDDDKYLAIVGKCIANNMPIMRYLGLINLDSTVGENIYNQIISFCVSNEISYHQIIHFGSDGASNMTGMKLILN